MLALGRKGSPRGSAGNDEPFNSEDLALLTAVAGQVATAIENGRLYRQLHLKAEEIGRMREFNENILESLDDGLVVFDLEERIVRWNRALETLVSTAMGHRALLASLRSAVRRGGGGAPWLRRHALSRALIARHRAGPGRSDDAAPARHSSGGGCSAAGLDGDIVTGAILLIEDITDRARLEQLQFPRNGVVGCWPQASRTRSTPH